MARKPKVSEHVRRRLARQERRRPENVREPRQYFLIVCEGEKSEPQYFEALKADMPRGVLEVHIFGEGRSTLGLIELAQRRRASREKSLGRAYDQVWVVFDRDSFDPQSFNSAIMRARTLHPVIECAWSNEAFELWYLLHFEFYQDAASRRDYQERLERAVSRRLGNPFKYAKNDAAMYLLLKTYGNVNQAIARAEELERRHDGENFADHNPCTLVYKLVRALIGIGGQ